jgi:ubiquinone/menaquinone biosynthesis C-methylase UbiE
MRSHKIASLFHKSLEYAIGFNAVWVVHLGKQNNLFRLIASSGRPVSPQVLARKAHMFAPAVKAWCSAAVCLGYLAEKNGRVVLPKGVKELVLDEQSPYYVAGQFTYSALRSLEYGSFGDLFLSGKAKPPSSANTIKAFEEVTSWDHYAFLGAIKTGDKKLHKMLLKGCKILDVGCGAGRFMQRVHAAYPKSEFTGIDPYADEIKGAKKEMDVTILRAGGETMDFQQQFDLVYLGESLYLMHDKQQALKNCYRALKKGGSVAILEGLLTEAKGCKTCKENKMIMTMQLDFVLQGHEFMTKKQITALLKHARFRNIKFIDLGVSFYLVTADKI